MGLALIQKIPTPITPVRIDKEHRHITLAILNHTLFLTDFLKKRRQWCLKFLSRKAGKISVTFRKIKAVCVEKLRRKTIFFFQSVIESPVPIFIISCNGMTDGCKMSTDLMRLSSDQMNL